MKTLMRMVPGGILAAVGLFCAASAVHAADNTVPPPATQPAQGAIPRPALDPETLLQRMRSRVDTLNLSADQKQQIDDAFAKAGKSLKLADQELQNATRAQKAEHLREVYQQLRQSINSALTPGQLKQFRQLMAAAPSEMLNRLRAAVAKLQLSDDQKQKVHDLLEDVRGKLQQAGSEAKAAGQDAGQKMRAIDDDLRQKLGDILTDDQKLQLRNLMESPAPPTTRPANAN